LFSIARADVSIKKGLAFWESQRLSMEGRERRRENKRKSGEMQAVCEVQGVGGEATLIRNWRTRGNQALEQ